MQAEIIKAYRAFLNQEDFIEFQAPKLIGDDAEGGANSFDVTYFKHTAHLAQSPQLYKQMLVPVFERVFLTSHAYRAEPSVTTRHLSESVQMDCELGFVDFTDLLNALEFVGKNTLNYITKTCHPILNRYNIPHPSVAKVPRLTMREAQKIILERTGVDHTAEQDLMPEDERETHKRAFYTAPDPKDPTYSLSYDLLFRGMEILSGSQRIHDQDQLVSVMKDKGLNPANFAMYLQSFKYGMPPEGGFSFGLERLTMQFLKLGNIREASLFPRDMERVDFRLS